MTKNRQIITAVEPDSIAQEMEIAAGDELVSINGEEIQDIFDYHFLSEDEYLEVLIRKPDGEEWLLEVEKEEDEPLGMVFAESLMDSYRSCRNKCIFCFIDQMPKGMRDTLYFKDDDSRLSFLQGNYVTLTNMDDSDLDRIIRYNLSPINISFQCMNKELRCRMLNNRFAGDIFEKTKKLIDAGITVNGQIVLCRGINDKEELDFSLSELFRLGEGIQSISVVPVGLTDYRKGLPELIPFEKQDAENLLDQLALWQQRFKARFGRNTVYASDEWYLLAEREFPEDEAYDGYVQLENGVGMIRLLVTEFMQCLKETEGDARKREVTVATGRLAEPAIRALAEKLKEKFPHAEVHTVAVENRFFGSRITVAGLITGKDLVSSLAGRNSGSEVLISSCMLKADEDIFLDDMRLDEVSEALKVPVIPVDSAGEALLAAFIGEEGTMTKRRQTYEQTRNCRDWET